MPYISLDEFKLHRILIIITVTSHFFHIFIEI